MWAVDHEGVYPESLKPLVPKYLKTIPECPVAAADTYSTSYQRSRSKLSYGVCCVGDGHARFGYQSNQPSYNGLTGLIDGLVSSGAPSVLDCQQSMRLQANHIAASRSEHTSGTSCPPDYWVESYPGGFEVLCLSHAHGGEGAPPLYPRYDSAQGIVPFHPLPLTSPARTRFTFKQVAPIVALVLALALVGARRRRNGTGGG
jgi:hypothetical protein